MKNPAPTYGRGWVCVALLLGFCAGGSLTWAALVRWEARSSVARLARANAAVSPEPATAVIAVVETPTPLAEAGPDLGPSEAGPRLLVPPGAGPGGAAPTAVTWEGPAEPAQLPSAHLDSDRLPRSHPKAEGCLANALAAMAPFTKKGFDLRDKVWEGQITLEEARAIACQFFKGNDYCFSVGTDAKGARLSLQFYDGDGAPADADQFTQESAAGASATACLRCRQTGTYVVVVKLEAATQEKVSWGMVSAYR